jgi:predicted nucleic acid-binding protein
MSNHTLIIADTGAIISLVIVDKLWILEKIFSEFYIASEVWNELQKYYKDNEEHNQLLSILKEKVKISTREKSLESIMDDGENESICLYKELNADYLIIEDKKARNIASSLGVNCIGVLTVLEKAKVLGLTGNLRDLFILLLKNNRYYSKDLLNHVLTSNEEEKI